MKNTALLAFIALLAMVVLVPGAIALGPQPEPPDREIKIRAPHPGIEKTVSMGTPMPIPPSRIKGKK